jgi:trans-2,3-dihydro-3-hydroxyanthranilate isomerase
VRISVTLATMPQHRYVLVDVFTDAPLTGNPLAVFTDARGLRPEQMARIANELNLSETIFILPAEGEGDARVRIFTPRAELPFAGHPIIGASWVIGRGVALDLLRLETGVGIVPVQLQRHETSLSRAVMSQPRPAFSLLEDPGSVLEPLGLNPPAPGESVEVGDNGLRVALVPAPSREALAGLTPDFSALARADVQTVCVWSLNGDGVEARVFAPAVGVDEDPATGSAAGPLGALLVRRGLLPPGDILVHQGTDMGRPSLIEVEVTGEGDVLVGGACSVIGRGFLDL